MIKHVVWLWRLTYFKCSKVESIEIFLKKKYCVSFGPFNLFPECIIIEDGGLTEGPDAVEVLEESRPAEVSQAFIWRKTAPINMMKH